MPSFVSILKGIGHVLGVAEHIAAPIAEVAFPQFAVPIAAVDHFVTATQTAIQTGELQSPVGGGPAKLQLAQDGFDAALALTQEILKSQGKLLTYDGPALQKAINLQVGAYQAFSDLKTTFKIVDTAKPAS